MLITGGTGFLGRAVAARLPGARAVGVEEVDLTDGAAVAALIADRRPEVVIHLAARVGGITANISRQADFLVDNLRIDANVLAALRVHPPRHLIAMLSTCMYPDRLPDDRYPMTEDLLEAGPPPPTNAAYAAAKRALWHGTRALREQYGVPYTCIVPANLYGPGDHYGADDSHFLAAAVDRIERARHEGTPRVEFLGTGRPRRQYVYVDDVAGLVAHLVESGPLDDTVNVAPDGHESIRGLAEAVAGAAGYEGEIVFPGRGPDGQFRKDVTAARLRERVPAWADIETPLAEGLRRTVEWYRDHVEAR
jgi:GDP-L-fucose synthase